MSSPHAPAGAITLFAGRPLRMRRLLDVPARSMPAIIGKRRTTGRLAGDGKASL